MSVRLLACLALVFAFGPGAALAGDTSDELPAGTRDDGLGCGNVSCDCGAECGCGSGCRCGVNLGAEPAAPMNGQTYDASNVVLLKRMGLTEFGQFTSGSDCWGYVSPGGREYALMGLNSGVAFVDITDVASVTVVGTVAMPSSFWKDTAVHNGYAYIVSDSAGDGIRIVDVRNIDQGTISVAGTVTPGGVTRVHSSLLNGNYLYLCGSNSTTNGLIALDLTNPLNPMIAGSYGSGGYVHDVQVKTYTEGPYAGREIAFCFMGPNGLDVVDVTNKSNMVRLSRTTYANIGYCHQGWLGPTGQYLYVNDELDERNSGAAPALMRIFDVSNLSAPQLVGTWSNGQEVIDHNCYIKDGFLYTANYRAGVRILDIRSTPTAPVEVGHIDTFPGADALEFNGAWSVYPYFPSGKVIVSDIESGLFIIDPTYALNGGVPLSYSYPSGLPSQVPASGGTVEVQIDGINGGELDGASPQLTVEWGKESATVDMTALGGGRFRGVFPAMPCPSEAKFYITARSTNGLTVRDPLSAPLASYGVIVAGPTTLGFADNFEADRGWTVGAPGDDATSGIWQRADPVGTAAQPADDNPSGTGTLCYVTGAAGGSVGANDVDGGSTTLTSPRMTALGGGIPYAVYFRWYSNDQGGAANSDSMPVLISNDDGATWTQLELVTENTNLWVERRFRIDEFVAPTDRVRLRFIARDLGAGSIVEAAVDDVRIEFVSCATASGADLNGDGVVNAADLAVLLGSWGACAGCPQDIDGDGQVNANDLAALLGSWE